VSIQGMGYGIGYLLGTIYHLGPPDYEDKYLKRQRKLRKADAIFNKRMESLYGDAWEKIRDKRVAANTNRMLGR